MLTADQSQGLAHICSNTMKLYPNKDETKLYVRSMGKMLKITAIFDDDDSANKHMAKPDNNDGVVATSGNLVLLADVYDKGQ